MSFLNQPASSSFRFVNVSPDSSVPTFVPKIEPLWFSVVCDMRDAIRYIIDSDFRKSLPY